MKLCKFCGREESRLSKGYCHNCYMYFIINGFDTYYPSQKGELARVQKVDSNQYGWPICHICGKAFTKLQQHIWYAHNMSKNDYCDLYGLDRSINMTSEEYNKKMSDYAYKYNMPNQLIKAGEATRFKKGHNLKYKRSLQTIHRLEQNQFKSKKGNGMVLADPIRLELQDIVNKKPEIKSNDIITRVLYELDCYYWIYEVSKDTILDSILNNIFENEESKWLYLIVEKNFDEVHCITDKNAVNFDLNILYRKEYRYIYKIVLFSKYADLKANERRDSVRILSDKTFQSYLQYGIFNINLIDGDLYVNDVLVTTYGFPKISERNLEIVKLRLLPEKVTFEDIGKAYGLTKQRVAQIYNSTILSIKYRYFYHLTKVKGGM